MKQISKSKLKSMILCHQINHQSIGQIVYLYEIHLIFFKKGSAAGMLLQMTYTIRFA